MAFVMDKLLIVDVEATCWETPAEQAKHNQEIIEVGLVVLDLRDEIEVEDAGSLFVCPTTSVLSDFCIKLTGIQHDDVASGESFSSVCGWLREYHKSQRLPWASWGDFDRLAFERQCLRENVPRPWGRTHFNLKALFSIAMNMREQVGVVAALAQLGMEFEGDHHRALYGAKNITRIAIPMLTGMRKALREKYE